MRFIVGLSGRKQSGKDTICNHLMGAISLPATTYSFADPLKRFCVDVMGLREEQCYGTDDDKNTDTIYEWSNLPVKVCEAYLKDGELPTGKMTARAIMQVFGTNVMRDMFDKDIWVNGTFNLINADKDNEIGFISDTRFPSEVDAIAASPNGYIIRLTRKVAEDTHISETALDEYNFKGNLGDKLCLIDNQNMAIGEQNKIALDFLDKIIEKGS